MVQSFGRLAFVVCALLTAAPTVVQGTAEKGRRDAEAVAGAAEFFLRGHGRLARRDCSGAVAAILARAGFDFDASVRQYWLAAKREDRVHWQKRPMRGDLVFFDGTYDANRNGRVDDVLTHIGVVTQVDGRGTAVAVHYSSRKGFAELRLNLHHRDKHRLHGRLVNSYIRNKRYGERSDPGMAGQLWRAFARVKRPTVTEQIIAGRPLDERSRDDRSCAELWTWRNAVYARHNYAFSSKRARRLFGRQPWYVRREYVTDTNIGVFLTRTDRANIAQLRKLERQKGCPSATAALATARRF